MAKGDMHLRQELEKRIRFETLISDISARFMRLPSSEVDGEIERTLKKILDFFDVDMCAVLGIRDDKEFGWITHACYAEGTQQVPKDINLVKLFPWAYEMLILKGLPVRVERLTELPPEAEQDRLSCLAMGFKSYLTIPLFCAQDVRYVLTIRSLRNEHDWPMEFLPRLNLVGDIIVNALERRNADQALRESESRLHLAADSAGAGLWTLETGTGIFWVTEKTRELLGYPPDSEISFEQFLHVVHPDDRERIRQIVQEALQSKEFIAVQYRIIHPDGSIRWMLSRGRMHSGTPEETNRFMGATVDITERKQAEKQLAERLQFETLLTNLSASFINFPADQVDRGIADAQQQVCELLDIDISVLWQMPSNQPTTLLLTHIYAPVNFPPVSEVTDARESFPWCLERLLKGENICLSRLSDAPAEAWRDVEAWQHFGLKSLLTLPLSAGGVVFGALNFNTIRQERDWPVDLINRLQLIAEVFANALIRKRSELALRESEEKLRMAMDAAGAGAWSMDIQSKQVWVSGSQRELFGFQADEDLTYDSFLHVIYPDDRESVRTAIEKALRTKTPLFVQYRILRPDGSICWFAARGYTHCNAEAEPDRLMGISTDITERKRAEEETLRLREEYTHMARVSAMGELTASLAHELKQPLAAIRSNAQAALRFLTGDKPDIDELHEVLKDIISDNRRADEVIKKLRTLMRKSKLQITDLDMKEAVQDVLPLVTNHETLRKISLQLELDETIPRVTGDRIQIQQVILNLILNSTEALMSRKQPLRSILVRTYQQDSRTVTLSVQDNGPGIEEKAMPHLFEAFYTTKQEGLGMGLAICRSIVEEHGGRLWAENNPDGGATFSFTIPLARENLA